jgi:hypothetical protein
MEETSIGSFPLRFFDVDMAAGGNFNLPTNRGEEEPSDDSLGLPRCLPFKIKSAPDCGGGPLLLPLPPMLGVVEGSDKVDGPTIPAEVVSKED